MVKDYDYLDLQNLSFIGGQIAQKDSRYQYYAGVGFDNAEILSYLEISKILIKWIEDNKAPTILDVIELAKKIFYEVGISELMTTLKELTRITMIKGESQEWIDYGKR